MKELITLTQPSAPQSEAYRSLRTNLSFYSLDNPLKTVVVAPPTPDDTAAEAAANLAITMAQGGKRTVLVEANLRRPQIHTFFDLTPEPGLTNLLIDGKQGQHVAVHAGPVENLSIMPSGPLPPNPADLLGSKKLDEMIAQLSQSHDMLIFNGPPILAASDTIVLGAKVDGVVLAISSGNTRRDLAQKGCDILQKANVRIIGAALLNAPQDHSIGTY